MKTATPVLLIAALLALESCRTTKQVSPTIVFPNGVIFPTAVDPIAGPRRQNEPTLGEIEKPGWKDSVEVEGVLAMVDPMPDSVSYSLFRIGNSAPFPIFKEDFSMKNSGILYDWTGKNVGKLRVEFDSSLCANNGRISFGRRDSLKRGDPSVKLVIENPEFSWGNRMGVNIPKIPVIAIDSVGSKDDEYFLTPRLKRGSVCEPIRLKREKQDGPITSMYYETSLRESVPFRPDEKGRMTYGGKRLKNKKPFYVTKHVDPAKVRGVKKQKHNKRSRRDEREEVPEF